MHGNTNRCQPLLHPARPIIRIAGRPEHIRKRNPAIQAFGFNDDDDDAEHEKAIWEIIASRQDEISSIALNLR